MHPIGGYAGVVAATERAYAGRTPSQRSADRRAALIDAALNAIVTDGWRQLRIEHVCRRAGLNKRYFYESFRDIDDLSHALVDDLIAGLFAAAAPAETYTQLSEVVEASLTGVIVWLTDDPRRARVLFGELGSTPAVAEYRTTNHRRLAKAIAAHARSVHPEARPDDPMAELGASSLVGGLGHVVLDWLDGQIPMTREQLIDDLTALWLITGDGAARHTVNRTGSGMADRVDG